MITLQHILQALTGINNGESERIITETIVDSRKAIPGSLFIALPGEKVNGHQFIGNAFHQGAHLALIQEDVSSDFHVLDVRDYLNAEFTHVPEAPFCIRVDNTLSALQEIARHWRSMLSINVIGITGSVGKSSTKELVADVLSHRFRTYKNPGNYNNEIGLPLTIMNIGDGYDQIVLEMGFYYPGEITFLCEIAKPSIGIITNVGTVHAERAGSQEMIAKGKSELVQCLPESPNGTAILNFDDPLVKQMATITKARVIFYGLDSKADIWADDIRGMGLKGIQFRMHYQGNSVKLEVPILGRHSVQTILCASAAGLVSGMTMEEVADALVRSNTQLRMVAVQSNSGALILDDTYNATPESMLAALDLLNEIKGQKIAVLGDMLELGNYEKAGHEKVGRRAAEVVNYLIAVGPRSKTIAETAKQQGLPPTAVTWVEDTSQALDLLRYNLKSGDVVLIKGSHGLRMDRISAELEAVH